MGLSRRHTRSRLGESRRQTKLFYQQILEEMDRERPQLNELVLTHSIPEDDDPEDDDEATLH
jgi:hypothetical protein